MVSDLQIIQSVICIEYLEKPLHNNLERALETKCQRTDKIMCYFFMDLAVYNSQKVTVNNTYISTGKCIVNLYWVFAPAYSTLLPALMGEPRARSSVTMSTLPSWAARCSGVIPCRVTVFVRAPYSSKVVLISIWFFLAAIWRGV